MKILDCLALYHQEVIKLLRKAVGNGWELMEPLAQRVQASMVQVERLHCGEALFETFQIISPGGAALRQ